MQAMGGSGRPLPMEGKMDGTDFKILIDLIARKIERSTPVTAEYWRGYCQGIKTYFQQRLGVPAFAQLKLLEIESKGQGGSYPEAYARGYWHGSNGEMPSSY